MAERRLFGEHICVLTTNKALAQLLEEIYNASPSTLGRVKLTAAHGSWALQSLGNDSTYAMVDWKTLTVVGWEHIGFRGPSWLSGPWLGDGA